MLLNTEKRLLQYKFDHLNYNFLNICGRQNVLSFQNISENPKKGLYFSPLTIFHKEYVVVDNLGILVHYNT